MRVTKAMLLERIKSMESFMRCDLAYSNDEIKLRNTQGFRPVETYATGIPHKNELGRIGNTRILGKKLDKWEAK